MSFLFGAPQSISTTENKASAMQLQNSSQGLPVAIVYGMSRIAGDNIWYGDFTAIPHEQSTGGGKGLGGGGAPSTMYTYTTGIALAVCEGPITGYGQVWADKSITTTTALGLTEFLGSYTQSPWTYLTTNHPTEAYNYRGTAYLASGAYDLGARTGLPNLSFEVKGLIYDSAIYDVVPPTIMSDMLQNAKYGALFPSAQIGDLSDFTTYCKAMNIAVSPTYTTQQPASTVLAELALAGNAALVWSEGVLKVIPYADQTVSGTWLGTL